MVKKKVKEIILKYFYYENVDYTKGVVLIQDRF